MQLDSSILLILVISSAIFQDTLATGFKRIKVAKCKRGRISSIDLNVTPEFLPEESNSMDTTQYHKVMLPGNNEESNDFGKNTLTTDTQAFSDNSHSFQNPSNPLSGLQTPEHTVNRRKSNHQNVLSAKNSVGHKIFKQKTRPLEDIYKSGAALKDSLSMLESMRTNSKSLASPTKNCEKSRVELREYRTGIRRPKKYNQDSLRSKELSKSGNLQQECSTPQAIQDKTSKHLNSIPQSLAKPNNLDDELLRLISLVKQAQGQGNCSHQVNIQTCYPPWFKKMVVEKSADFESQTAAAAHHNIPPGRLSTWIQEYIESGGNTDCWNYIEERNKFKKGVVKWHKLHGCNINKTAKTFHVNSTTLYRWLKEEEVPGTIESGPSRDTPIPKFKVTKYSDELKREVVEYYQKSKKTQDQVARSLGLPFGMITKWQKKVMQEKGTPQVELLLDTQPQDQDLTKVFLKKKAQRKQKGRKIKIET